MTLIRLTATPAKGKVLDLTLVESSKEDLRDYLTPSSFEIRNEKDGLAVVAAIFRPCPPRCHNNGSPEAVDCGGGKFHRLAKNVSRITGFFADLDDVDRQAVERVVGTIRKLGVLFWIWETFSHEPDGYGRGDRAGRFRMFIPFLEPLAIASPEQWRLGAWPRLVRYLSLEGILDVACSDCGRANYMPSKPTEQSPRAIHFYDGKFLDAPAVVGDFARLAPTPMNASHERLRRLEAPDQEISLEQLDQVRLALRRYAARCPPAFEHQITALLRREMPGALPGIRESGAEARNVVWKNVLWVLSTCASDWMSSAVLLEEFVRRAWDHEVRECAVAHEAFTEWSTLEDLFARARPKTAAKRAQQEADRRAFIGLWSDSPQAQRDRLRALAASKARLSGSRAGGK